MGVFMRTNGIRILDKNKRKVSVELEDLFEEIRNGNLLEWTILYFYGIVKLNNGKSVPEFEDEINKSSKGLLINWKDLNELAANFLDVYDILIIGCKDSSKLIRYENDQIMYETCDIVIEMFDSSFWEVFSNDESLIKRLAEKFNEIQYLKTNFKKTN
jgi:hypothetical protein